MARADALLLALLASPPSNRWRSEGSPPSRGGASAGCPQAAAHTAVCAKGLMFTRSLNPQNHLQGEMWLLFPFYTGENEAQRASEVQI